MESNTFTGYFTSTGAAKVISFASTVNYMWVYNYTQIAGAAAVGVQYYWQYGMPQGGGLIYTVTATPAITLTALAAGSGFTAFNNSVVTRGPAVALTAITAANPPVVSSGTTPTVGSIVTLSNLTSGGGAGFGQRQIAGMDFTVTAVNAGVSFTIGNISLLNSTATTAGSWRLVSSDPEFYPRVRQITWITESGVGATSPVPAGTTRIYTSVTHGYLVGQKINLEFPGGSAVWGNYAALNNVVATITAINTPRNGGLGEPNNGGVDNNFDINVDSTGFGAWNVFVPLGGNQSFLANTQFPQGPALCIPFGEDTAYAQSIVPPANVLADSFDNVSVNGILLAGGAGTPGGAAGDLMCWVAGSSFDGVPPIPSMTTP